MSLEPSGPGEFGFVDALMKRGFINLPRMLFDYTLDLGLDYDRIGKVFAVLSCVGGAGESPFGSYVVTRRSMPRDFDQVKTLVLQLQDEDITRCDEATENRITFSFTPLYSRLRAVFEDYYHEHQNEQAKQGPHPAVSLTERMLGRPLSVSEVRSVLDWVEDLGFSVEMVEAIIQEGQRQGKLQIKYLTGIAKNWAQRGLQTPEQAEAYNEEHYKNVGRHRNVKEAVGIKRSLTASEKALIERWYNEWGFDDDVILQACEQAVGSDKPLIYMNSVLEAWLAEGIRTLADVEAKMEQKRRTAAAGAEARPSRTRRKQLSQSNVILKGGKEDEEYYDGVFKRYSD